MTTYDKFAIRPHICFNCGRRFIFEPYNEILEFSILERKFTPRDYCRKCSDKLSEEQRKGRK